MEQSGAATVRAVTSFREEPMGVQVFRLVFARRLCGNAGAVGMRGVIDVATLWTEKKSSGFLWPSLASPPRRSLSLASSGVMGASVVVLGRFSISGCKRNRWWFEPNPCRAGAPKFHQVLCMRPLCARCCSSGDGGQSRGVVDARRCRCRPGRVLKSVDCSRRDGDWGGVLVDEARRGGDGDNEVEMAMPWYRWRYRGGYGGRWRWRWCG